VRCGSVTEGIDPSSDCHVKHPHRAEQQAERERIDRELANLMVIAAAGGAETTSMIAEIKKRELRKTGVDRILNRPFPDE
jgi:ribosomal protein L29